MRLALHDTPGRGVIAQMQRDLARVLDALDEADRLLSEEERYGGHFQHRDECRDEADKAMRYAWKLLEATVTRGSREVFR